MRKRARQMTAAVSLTAAAGAVVMVATLLSAGAPASPAAAPQYSAPEATGKPSSAPTTDPTAAPAEKPEVDTAGTSDQAAAGAAAAAQTAAAGATAPAPQARLDRTWSTPSSVNRALLRVPAGSISGAVVAFSDGSRLLLTPDDTGRAEVAFPARAVTSAALTFLGEDGSRRSAVVDSWELDSTGAARSNDLSSSTATTSFWATSNGGGVSAEALIDGDPASGSTGNEWAPNPSDTQPAVAISWSAPQEIASVQIIGPSTTGFDPAYDAAAELYGQLVFDDGSTVDVAGVDAGQGQPTTVAFAPRMTSSVEFRLRPTIRQAFLGLREFRAYPRGVTPPRWNSGLDAPGRTADIPVAADCGAAPAVGTAPSGGLALSCPAPGAAVGGSATVAVLAPAGVTVDASAWVVDTAGGGALSTVASATADATGRAVLRFSTDSLLKGPFALRVTQRGATTAAARFPLHIQLWNTTGRAGSQRTSFAPSGMTLQWAEEFRAPLSVSRRGDGAVYAATKPAYWGAAEFGDAYFSDPSENRNTLATLGGDYLRIRVQPIHRVDPWGWNRKHESGILSSGKVGAGGFSAQYGYFEARMLGAAGRGSWPAFWMMNSEYITKRANNVAAEVDAVELYGQDTTYACNGLHSWIGNRDTNSQVRCTATGAISDWAASWHTYGVQIRPGGADFYIDGRLIRSAEGIHESDGPFFFMLNQALGGGYPVALGPTGDVIDTYVDWVRVYT